MFPKNKIDIIYRLLCLISYITALFIVNSHITLIILGVIYAFFALCEKSFRNIEFIVITIIIFFICRLMDNYLLYKLMMIFDYCYYYLDTGYYIFNEEKIVVSKKEYIRFSKNKKKGSNNLLAVYLTVHLGLLVIAIMVG